MEEKLAGVYEARLKNGTASFRSSITYKGRHISLGSFSDKFSAHEAYLTAEAILRGSSGNFDSVCYDNNLTLSFEKWVMLYNLHDNHIYFSNPMYVRKKYFEYYLAEDFVLTFDIDDLFYYSAHKIMRRGGHLFVADYGSQINLKSRYGLKPFSVAGRDHIFVNGDENDYRYHNIKIINRYNGVRKSDRLKGGMHFYTVIHINGDVIVGRYKSALEAAIAYNKAADIINSKGLTRAYRKNYIEECNAAQYKKIYEEVEISDFINSYNDLIP